MSTPRIQISLTGKAFEVPCAQVQDQTVVVLGKLLKIARIHGEEWSDRDPLDDPDSFIRDLKNTSLTPDIFTFAQQFFDVIPRFPYPLTWDNVAAIPITTFDEWWGRRVSRKLRQDITRSERLGVVVKGVPFDDQLVRGIVDIYNETPLRQGRRFWHYGKDFSKAKLENSTYLDRSEFVAAYYNDELIGFLKIVYVGRVARLMQILAKIKHNDKRPLNALIAKAVDICSRRGCLYLVYGKYTYDAKKDSSIAEFKRRNGFQEIVFPRYYVPLTFRGRLLIGLGLHLGLKRFIPSKLLQYVLDLRTRLLEKRYRARTATHAQDGAESAVRSTADGDQSGSAS